MPLGFCYFAVTCFDVCSCFAFFNPRVCRDGTKTKHDINLSPDITNFSISVKKTKHKIIIKLIA